MAKAKDHPAWYQRAAEMMVRENKSLFQAAQFLDEPVTKEEADRISKTKMFQQTIWLERNKFYSEIAQDPSRTKSSALGLMYLLVHELMKGGDYKEALEGMLKLSKVEGWVGAEGNVNIFHEVTTKDLDEARKHIESLVRTSGTTSIQPDDIFPSGSSGVN